MRRTFSPPGRFTQPPISGITIRMKITDMLYKRALMLLFITCALARTIPAQTAAEIEPTGRPSVALVLAGGGAKGFAHIPVLELLEELDIPIDMVIGNSAGAIIGGLYCAGYSPAEIANELLDLNWAQLFQDEPVSPFESLLGNRSTFASPVSVRLGKNFSFDMGAGLSTGQNAYMRFKQLTAKIPSYIDFDSLPIPFRATAVNLLTGDLDIIGTGDIAEAIRSSMSIPAVFQPFPVDGKLYVDGLVRNNMPIQPVADLGYDIIIAIELGDELIDNPSKFASTPLTTVSQVMTIFMYSGNKEQYKLSDIVLYPDVAEFSTFDYPKSRQIYEKAIKDKERFREPLRELRKKIFPEQYAADGAGKTGSSDDGGSNGAQLKTAERTSAGGGSFAFTPIHKGAVEPDRNGVYDDLPYLIPEVLVTSGAAVQDMDYIETYFEKIRNKPLTPDALNDFISAVYHTGNYTLAIPRIDTRYAQTRLELRLHQIEKENWLIIPGAAFEGTVSDQSVSKLTFSLDIQFRGLTGTGSVLSVKSTMINNLGAALMYMQPIGAHSYVQLSADVIVEQEFVTSGFQRHELQGNRLSYSSTGLLFGVKFGSYHRMQIGGSIYWMDTDGNATEELEIQQNKYRQTSASIAAPLNIGYTFDTFDYPSFPTRGFYVKFDDTGVFPLLATEAPVAFNLCRVDFTAAVPLARNFSIIFNVFAGSDISMQLAKIPSFIPLFGYTLGDRTYFPQMAGKQQYGTHKAAAQIVFQFQPWQNLTIMGGQMFFSVSGSIGEVAMEYTDFTVKDIKWNASFNTGIRISKTFSVMFRLGAGTTKNTIIPFISVDFGTIRY